MSEEMFLGPVDSDEDRRGESGLGTSFRALSFVSVAVSRKLRSVRSIGIQEISLKRYTTK